MIAVGAFLLAAVVSCLAALVLAMAVHAFVDLVRSRGRD